MPPKVTQQNVEALSFNGVPGKDYGSTFAGGEWKVRHTDRFITAVSKPEEYLKERVQAIKDVNTKLNTEFCAKYANWLSQGVTPADALSRSEAYVMKISEALMAEVDLMYPEDIQQTAANLSYNKSSLGHNGVDPAIGKSRGRK